MKVEAGIKAKNVNFMKYKEHYSLSGLSPVIEKYVWNPEILGVDHNRVNASKFRGIPCHLIVLPSLDTYLELVVFDF